MKKGLAILLALMLIFPVLAFGGNGTTGKIAGVITDAETGDPLIGVNVYLVERPELGSPTDENGYYVILNVPPGEYTLKATYLGYKEVTVEQVRVTVDLTTTIDIRMEEAVIEGETVTITATRPIVERDVTSSRSLATKDDIENLPGGSVTGVASLKAGFVAGTFRGGRPFTNETVYVVDGVSMANPIGQGRVTGQTGAGNYGLATELPRLSVEEMEVITGGFNAEYGQAQSAVVNVISKQGARTRYSGEIRLEAAPGYLFGNNDFWNQRVQETYYGPNPMYSEDNPPPSSMREYQTIHYSDIPKLEAGETITDIYGTPLTAKNLRTTRQDNTVNRRAEINIGGPEPITTYLLKDILPGYMTFNLSGTYRHNEEEWNTGSTSRYYTYAYNSNANLTYKPNNSMTFTVSFMKQASKEVEGGPGYWKFADGLDTGDLFGFATGGTPVEVPNYLALHPNPNNDNQGYMEVPIKNLDPVTNEPLPYDDGGFYGFDAPRFKIPGSSVAGYSYHPNDITRSLEDVDQKKFTFKADLTSQVNDKHQVKTGVQVDYFDLYLADFSVASGGNDYNDKYHKFPLYGAAYIQDKIELEGMIVNVGLRFDYINPRAKYSQALETGQGAAVNPEYSSYQYVGQELRLNNPAKAEAKFQISPRIGISHPITEYDVLHFSYGHFFQYPQFDRYYTNYTLDLRGAFKYIGNPNIESEKTISYEVGFEHAFGEDMKLDVTGFVKNITDLVNTKEVRDQFGQNFYMYTNSDYANVRGFEFSLSKRFSNNWSGQVNYTLQWAKGKNSNVTQTFSDLYNNFVPRTKAHYLNWDRRHTLNAVVTYKVPENFGESFAGTMGKYIFGDWYMTVVYQYVSGQPYSSPSRSKNPPINDRRYPGYDVWNMRITKFIKTIGNVKLQAYADIQNVFDGRDRTGFANLEEYLSTGDPTQGHYSTLIWIWQNPRSMRLGVGARF